MTRSSSFEVISTRRAPDRGPRSRLSAAVPVAALAVVVGLAASVVMQRRLDGFLDDLDGKAINEAAAVFARSVEQQRRYAQSAVSVLAEDTRIRAPVMTPKFDENTVRDVLEDLKRSSGASMLAVLDATGKVRAVAGVQGMRELDLSASPVVKTAEKRPSTVVWAFPERVLVVGVAPVRQSDQVLALLVMGFEVGEPLFGAIQGAVGVAGALIMGDRVAASSDNSPAMMQAFRAARELEDDKDQVLHADREYVARVSRTSDSAAAAKVVWMIPRHHESGRSYFLRLMNWTPVALAALTFVLVLLFARRSA
jgi:hypothetical protein